MAQQSQSQDGDQVETVTVAPERLPPDNYLTVQILQGMPSLVARGFIYLTLLVIITGLVYASVTLLDVTVRCPAVVQPEQVSRLPAREAGRLEQVMVSPGQHVRKGEILLILQTAGDAGGAAAAQSIAADVDGLVLEMPVGDRGQAVRKGDLLYAIQPDSAGLRVDMRLPNKDVGLVVTGMPVSLRLDAYPVADFGVVHARVSAISPIAREDTQLGYVYPVSARLSQGWVESHGKRFPIRPGMTATAEIVVGRRSVLSALIRGVSD